MAARTLASITIAEIKAFHGYDESGKDTQLTAMLNLAIDFIKNYCGHDFQSAARTAENILVEGEQQEIFLKYWPVASITSLSEDGDALVENTDYYCDKDTGRLVKWQDLEDINKEMISGNWSTTPNAILCTYTGGHALTYDVEQVFYELVGIWAGLKTKTYVDGEGTQQSVTLKTVPPELYAILDRHRYPQRV